MLTRTSHRPPVFCRLPPVDVTAATASVGSGSGSGSFNVTTPAGCAWTVAGPGGFVTGFVTSGTGPATVDYDYAASVSVARSETLTVTLAATGATAEHVVSQASGCTASLSPADASASEAAGSGDFELTLSDAACPWTASSDAAWLTLPIAAGTGDATVDYELEANIGPERVGTITIAGQTFELTQASGCVVSVSASQAVVAAGGTGSVAVDTEPGCTWTATTTTPWLGNVTASGSGAGTIAFDFDANAGSARTGVIEVASDTTASTATHEVEQANGCVATLDAASASFGAGAGSGSIMLTVSAADCAWTASSSAPWAAVTPASGTGSTALGFTVDDNVSVARQATLTIAGETFAIDQESGCALTVTPASDEAPAAGGTLGFDLETDAACGWTASESIDWLSGLPASGTGPQTISLTIDANIGPVRDGGVTFTADDTPDTAVFTASQADGCVATLDASTLAVDPAGASSSFGLTLSSQACAWSAAASPFITVTNATGTGDATVAFEVAANDGPARTGTITIGDQVFTVEQGDGCTVSLDPSSAEEGAAAGTTTFDVVTRPAASGPRSRRPSTSRASPRAAPAPARSASTTPRTPAPSAWR